MHGEERNEEIVVSRADRPVTDVVPPARPVHRAGRGSLRDELVLGEDWDSPAVNAGIAHDLGPT